MPTTIKNILKEFGLNEQEISVHLACLECGSCFASHIARKAKINRSSCYIILDELIKKGLINKSGVEKKFQFTAEKPERLLSLIKEKESKAKELAIKFSAILPELKSLYSKHDELPKIKFIEGQIGVRAALDEGLEALSSGGELCHISPSIEALIDATGEEWLLNYVKKRVKKNIKCRSIGVKTPWLENDMKNDIKVKRETALLPKGTEIPIHLHIMGDKVSIFSLKKDLVGITIEDKDIAQTMKLLYQALWDKYKN